MNTLTAAIQFGSSRISAAAACIDAEGRYEVVGIESVASGGCIHHGCIVAIEETAQCIKSLMKKLSNRIKGMGYEDLDAAYVGVCGMSMHSMEYSPSILLNEELFITPEVQNLLRQQSLNLTIPGHDILGLKSNSEYIDGQYAVANHQLILADSKLMTGIRTAMERAQIRIAGVFTTPLLVGDILTDEEKRQGCLLLDLGAQLSTVSIYHSGELKYLNVLPLGSDCVTLDIATKGMRLEEAEEAKINWSNATPQFTAENPMSKAAKPCAIPIEELNLIVISRCDEIISNIAAMVERAGYKGLLEGGCVVTGGASTQVGLTSLLSKRLEISKISTRAYSRIRYSSSERKPHLTALMSMLSYCTESCQAKRVVPQAPAVSPAPAPATKPAATETPRRKNESKNGGTGFRSFFGDLFSGLDDDQEGNN